MIGSLIIDKPSGITSHTVVAKVRRAAGTRRVGHTGTLDPFATGVLVVCIGRATRLSQFLVNLDKEYLATVRLGFATNTQDLTGEQITPLETSKGLRAEDVRQILNEFRGPQMQLPPMYSAKKIGGERLYRAAREGREVERDPVAINVYSIELVMSDDKPPLIVNEDGTMDFEMSVRSSSGTYVRSLAHDIGQRLGTGAHLAALRRTAAGRFDIENAMTLDEVEKKGMDGGLADFLISPAETLSHLPQITLDDRRVKMVMNGREIDLSPDEGIAIGDSQQMVCLLDSRGALISVGDHDFDRKTARPRVVMAGTEE